MSEIKTLNGYSLADTKAREDIATLSEEIDALKGDAEYTIETFEQSGAIVQCEPISGTALTVKTDADVTVYSTGKNLVGKGAQNIGTKTRHGVTFTFEDDGSVTLNGTPSVAFYATLYANIEFADITTTPADHGVNNRLILPTDSPYRFSVIASGSIAGTTAETQKYPSIGVYLADKTLYNYNYYVKQQFASGEIIGVNQVIIGCLMGITYTNYNIKWQLEVGTKETAYEPHAGIAKTASSGEVTFYALDGVNTVWANSGNVTVSGQKYGISQPGYSTPFDPAEFGLPMLYLTGDASAMTKDNAVNLTYKYGDLSGTASVKWQGSSSLNYPKKNYTIKFDNAFEAKEGWGAQKKYCFKANFIDHTHARNLMCASIWGDLVKTAVSSNDRRYSLPNGGAVDGFPCIIMLNGKFHGLFTWNIPKDGWMLGMGSGAKECILCANGKRGGGADSFKSLASGFDGENDYDLEYITDENNTGWALTSLNQMLTAVINSNGSDLDTTVAQYLDWDSVIDHYIQTVLTGAADCTIKNYLLCTFDGVKWFFTGYDMDSTFGLYWNGKSFTPANAAPTFTSYASMHRAMEFVKTYKKDALKARYNALRAGALSEINITDKLTNYTAGIPSQVLDADAAKWPTIPSTSASNLAQMLNWYRLRVAVADAEIDAL